MERKLIVPKWLHLALQLSIFFLSYPNPLGAFENIRYKCVKVAGR